MNQVQNLQHIARELQILDLIHIILKLRITLKEYEGNF